MGIFVSHQQPAPAWLMEWMMIAIIIIILLIIMMTIIAPGNRVLTVCQPCYFLYLLYIKSASIEVRPKNETQTPPVLWNVCDLE